MNYKTLSNVILLPLSFIMLSVACAADKAPKKDDSRKDAGARLVRLGGIWTTMDATISVLGRGRTVEAYLNTDDDYLYGPVVFWIGDAAEPPIVVDSIASVNRVLKEIQIASENASPTILIENTTALLTHQRFTPGNATGVALVGTYRARFMLALENAMPTDKFLYVKDKLEEASCTLEEKSWRTSWVEVDRLGGVEKVYASGETKPWVVKRVERVSVSDAGTVPKEVLKATVISAASRPKS